MRSALEWAQVRALAADGIKGKSYRLRERGLDVAPAAQAPSLRDSA